ncbi:Holliday junction branch migration DNA helicase RuvB [Companilactobacillus sp.]|jgi:Holliday junction DNA helicase RuvB|uniref:Holliday junction branch migration DNA helicase RuvB n=1 Tax=Companilactobacillus sp. TaxID=2767905 RepID=UPI0025C72F25|nr:Holliday junction branch migration DNA helicase RuvB [Companilactobacillus sp.]MCH4010290.1 Holliday junction branch migration DNA helicase RuvB [Companilactobacillus sp.]MCH4052034.1 Holliday junction branch migration DNA helicase RuvB [Companilactobacillus sp.]MCH4078232.1 Holliday junction branch migration DNA helicase RuvB [Companilactobacillus sp.]MCH4126808.1 Holliday junction branch migration DNA helicase RuvB [Companilactobacillus sp.]MCH4132647.1 Holliday junction branch migration 
MDDKDRITDADALNEQEDQAEKTLRPQTFKDYLGQEKAKHELDVYIRAAKQRKQTLDHVLLYGPPGLGKTTLAMIIANEMGVNIHTTTGPSIEKSGDLVAVLDELSPGDVLFIDEIHRMPKAVEEVLYSAMEDFYIDIIVGQGTESRSLHHELVPYTLIGATTTSGKLSAPLRDRFGIVEHMEYYSEEELAKIIFRSADVLNIKIDEDGAHELARRSRGTPRIANRLLKRVRDFAQVGNKDKIDYDIAKSALNQLQVDDAGLDSLDRRILSMMIELYGGGPLGIKVIAANIGEDQETIESVYEPYLMQMGFLKRTARGRIVTRKGYEHLGYPYPEEEKK